MCTYLHGPRQGGTYYFRMSIPEPLRAYFGKREFYFSLRTKDPVEAKRRVLLVEAPRHVALVEQAEAELAGQQVERPVHASAPADPFGGMTHEQFEQEQHMGDEQTRQWIAEDSKWEDAEAWLAAQSADHPAVLLHNYQRDRAEAYKFPKRAAVGKPSAAAVQAAIKAEQPSTTPSAEGVGTMLDTDVIDRWAAERKVTPKGKDTHRAVARWFYDRIGDIPVAEITRAHVIAFKDRLLEEGQSLAIVKMKLSRLRTLLQWAADNDLAPSNVGHGVRIKGAAAGGSKRLPFALADLQAIFAGPVYTGGPRSKQGAGEAAFWLPLLALFTGARMEELGQLRPSDIQMQNHPDADGVGRSAWFIRITTLAEDGDEANRLKNEASERLVPIHSEIESLGFIDYVNAMRKAGHARIFPLLTPGAYNRLTGKWGQWFSRYMRDVCKVTDRRKVFHSFRHTFKHFAGHVGMIEGVQRSIMGHSAGDVADDYRGGYTPYQLVEGMKVFKVAGLVLPRPSISTPAHTDTP